MRDLLRALVESGMTYAEAEANIACNCAGSGGYGRCPHCGDWHADDLTCCPRACPCGCPAEMHIGEIGCPCALPGEPPCNPTTESDRATVGESED